MHVPKDKRSKLDPTRRDNFFVWYSEISKDYKMHVLGFNKIGINRDVTFNEDATF